MDGARTGGSLPAGSAPSGIGSSGDPRLTTWCTGRLLNLRCTRRLLLSSMLEDIPLAFICTIHLT